MAESTSPLLAGLVKATLTIFPANNTGSPQGSTKKLTFTFNPKEYTIAKTASWTRTDSKAAPTAGPVQWKGAQPRSINGLQVYLDKSDSESANIVSDAELLLSCCAPTRDSISKGKPSGPFVLFGWGTTVSFTAIISSVSIRYTMFRPSGEPYRAVATVNLEEVGEWVPRQNPTSGGLAVRKTHTVTSGQSLPLVAQSEYQKPALWRAIAQANNIDDPMRVAIGRKLLIPPRKRPRR